MKKNDRVLLSTMFILTHNRPDGSSYEEIYDKSSVYCPNCGEQVVYIGRGGDDSLGDQGICVSCGMSHHNAGDFYQVDNPYLLAALRSHFEQSITDKDDNSADKSNGDS